MAEHLLGLLLDILFGVLLDRKAGLLIPQKILDRHTDGVAGRFLLPPVIDLQLFRLEGRQQITGDLLDPGDVLLVQVRFEEKVV